MVGSAGSVVGFDEAWMMMQFFTIFFCGGIRNFIGPPSALRPKFRSFAIWLELTFGAPSILYSLVGGACLPQLGGVPQHRPRSDNEVTCQQKITRQGISMRNWKLYL